MKNKIITEYIALPDTFFDEGSSVILLEGPFFDTIDSEGYGIFAGKVNGKIVDNEKCMLRDFKLRLKRINDKQ